MSNFKISVLNKADFKYRHDFSLNFVTQGILVQKGVWRTIMIRNFVLDTITIIIYSNKYRPQISAALH